MRFYIITLTCYSIFATVLVVVLSIQNLELNKRSENPVHKANFEDVRSIPIGESPRLGVESAPVTLVIFADYECPSCAQIPEIISSLSDAYPDKVQFVKKHFPLNIHVNAIPALAAAFAAQSQDRFWEMDSLLHNLHDSLSDQTYLLAAESLGLDIEQFQQDLLSEGWKNNVRLDVSLGNQLGLLGTPTVFINGVKTPFNIELMKKSIDHMLAQGMNPKNVH